MLSLLGLTACGQKGNLYLPPPLAVTAVAVTQASAVSSPIRLTLPTPVKTSADTPLEPVSWPW